MEIRKSQLIGALVAAAALFVGAAGAQTFDQSVNGALSKDGSLLSQIPDQKRMSTQDEDMIEAQRGGRGGQRTPPGGGQRGGQQPGRGGHEEPGRGGDRGGRGGWQRHDGGWNRNGHYYYGYRNGIWLGWVLWNGVGSCRDWYFGRRASCYDEASIERDVCLENGEDPAVCNGGYNVSMDNCNYQWTNVYFGYWNRCLL